MASGVRRYFTELFSLGSRSLNVITGGVADMTFSARSYKDGLWTEHVIDFFLGEGHCKKWYYFDVQRAEDLIKEHNKREKALG
jgi:hypothetical protein